jgi:hypothetical protein
VEGVGVLEGVGRVGVRGEVDTVGCEVTDGGGDRPGVGTGLGLDASGNDRDGAQGIGSDPSDQSQGNGSSARSRCPDNGKRSLGCISNGEGLLLGGTGENIEIGGLSES